MNLTARGGPLTQLHRHEARLRRCYQKAMKELELLRAEVSEQGYADDEVDLQQAIGSQRRSEPSMKPDAALQGLIHQYLEVPKIRPALDTGSSGAAA